MRRKICIVLVAVLGVALAAPSRATSRCTTRAAAGVVKTFVTAYNRGDIRTLNRVFAGGPAFREYRVAPLERPAPFSEDRRSLMDYFRTRHDRGDEFHLVDLKVGRGADGQIYVQPTLHRASREGFPWSSGYFVPGKGRLTRRCQIAMLRLTWEPD